MNNFFISGFDIVGERQTGSGDRGHDFTNTTEVRKKLLGRSATRQLYTKQLARANQ